MTTPPLARVLIVEDDSDLLEVLQFVLEDGGYEVATAEGGPAALELASAQSFDLVILDVHLGGEGGQSGLDVARLLRAQPRTRVIPIALHSGLAEVAVRREFEDFDLFMPKIDDAEELLRRVASLVDQNKLARLASS